MVARVLGVKNINLLVIKSIILLYLNTTCLKKLLSSIIYETNPVFWCIENPVGKMREFLGKPKLIFDPCEFGDPYTKKTYLWGKFNIPGFFKDTSVKPTLGSKIHKIPPSADRKTIRSITPEGFAQAFFEANR